MIFRLILVLLLFYTITFAYEEYTFKIKGSRSIFVIRVFDKPVLNMEWIKLKKGGYMLSGDVSILGDEAESNCRLLTDFTLEELIEALKKDYGYTYNIYVKSLNSFVYVNKEPYMAIPLRMNVNLTATQDLFKINQAIKKEFYRRIKEDKSFQDYFNRLKEYFIKDGFDEKKAELLARKEAVKRIKPKLKSWIPEEKLPKKLYLLCQYSPADKKIYKLYPVKLSIKKEKTINILSVKKTDKYIKLKLSISPYLKPNKNFSIDVITINPPEIRLSGCNHGYLGVALYTERQDKDGYQLGLYGLDNGFFLNIYPYKYLNKFEVLLRLSTYCAVEKRDRISVFNPYPDDKSNMNSIVRLDYSHRSFLKEVGLESVSLKFKIISPDGFSSDTISISLP